MPLIVVESIEDGTLVYRDGSRLGEVTVAVKPTVELARVASPSLSAVEKVESKARLVNALRAGPSVRQGRDGPPVE